MVHRRIEVHQLEACLVLVGRQHFEGYPGPEVSQLEACPGLEVRPHLEELYRLEVSQLEEYLLLEENCRLLVVLRLEEWSRLEVHLDLEECPGLEEYFRLVVHPQFGVYQPEARSPLEVRCRLFAERHRMLEEDQPDFHQQTVWCRQSVDSWEYLLQR